MSWIDSHAHIASSEFDEDRNDVIKRIEENDIAKVLIVATSFEEADKALEICDRSDRFDMAVGIFPTEFEMMTEENLNKVEEFLKNEHCVALGEIGLDYYWDKDNHELQKEWFRKQINLANKYNKPILVHSRDAIQDTYDIIKDLKPKGLMHCYSNSVEMAKEFIKLGFYISLAGPITFKKSVTPKEVAKIVPIDRILIETDCPYMTPEPFRGKRNEPMYVKYTGLKVCDEAGYEVSEFQKHIYNNYMTLFY